MGNNLKSVESQETNSLNVVEQAAKTKNPQEVGSAFDIAQETAEKKQYQEDKLNVIKNITTWKLNPDYNTVSPDPVEYKNKLFLSSDPTQVKAYLAYYNLQIIKDNRNNKTDVPLVDIDAFMKNFEKEQIKTKKNNTISGDGSVLTPEKVNQKVGEFIDLPKDRQDLIQKTIGEMKDGGQHIQKLTLYGYADATEVTADGETLVKERFTGLRQALIGKGMDIAKLPSADLLKDATIKDQNLLNKGWAYVRAMMQIAFLPDEYIKYINNNTDVLVINTDAKKIGGAEKGNQYTGGNIETETVALEKGKPFIEQKNTLLKMIDFRQVNYAFLDDKGDYHIVGYVQLKATLPSDDERGKKQGLLTVVNQKYDNTESSLKIRKDIGSDKTNKQNAFFEPKNKDVNTAWVIIGTNDTRVTKTTDGGINLPATLDGFVEALAEFKKNSKDDKDKSSYADNVITILQTYKDVDTQLQKVLEVKKTTI